MKTFVYPLSGARHNKVVAALAAGESIRIGSVSLHPDEDLIWGVDSYGCDGIAATHNDTLGIAKAINWVHRQHAPDFIHSAEIGACHVA